ncbi:hypothetical protein GCM10010172_15350 [Paractinoplanes ferrugineus]|uniref:Uncharacterized protein n=2 Tax=Paractinoplanes ferrugineus TaxID=113564 RepID=A0A919MD17_9ACTN|nr:hypothetical protein Afe05nite_19390 [Actinoplanes ferrugineus]
MDESGHSGDTGAAEGGNGADSRERARVNGWATQDSPWSNTGAALDAETDVPAWRRATPFPRNQAFPPPDRGYTPGQPNPLQSIPVQPASAAPAPTPAPTPPGFVDAQQSGEIPPSVAPTNGQNWSDTRPRYSDLLAHLTPPGGEPARAPVPRTESTNDPTSPGELRSGELRPGEFRRGELGLGSRAMTEPGAGPRSVAERLVPERSMPERSMTERVVSAMSEQTLGSDPRPVSGGERDAAGRPTSLRSAEPRRYDMPAPSSAPPYPYEGDLDDSRPASALPAAPVQQRAAVPLVRPAAPAVRRPDWSAPEPPRTQSPAAPVAAPSLARPSYDPSSFPRRVSYDSGPAAEPSGYVPPPAYASFGSPAAGTGGPAEPGTRGLPQRVPAQPDVPRVPEPPLTEPTAETPELARIATHLRRGSTVQPREREEGFDVQAILTAVRGVDGVRDASLRATPSGAHSLRLDLAEGADPAEVSRRVARLLQDRMGLDAAMKGDTAPMPTAQRSAPPAPAPPTALTQPTAPAQPSATAQRGASAQPAPTAQPAAQHSAPTAPRSGPPAAPSAAAPAPERLAERVRPARDERPADLVPPGRAPELYGTDTDAYRADADAYRAAPKPRRADAESYQSGAAPYRADAEPYQADAEPYQADAEPYQAGGEPRRTDTQPYSADAESYQAGTESRRADAETYPASPGSRRADAEARRVAPEPYRDDAESRRADAEPYGSDPEARRPDPSRAELSRTELSRTELSRFEPSHGGLSHGGLSHGGLSRTEQSRNEQAREEQTREEQSHGKQSHGEPSREEQAHGEPFREEQSHGEPSRTELSRNDQSRNEQSRNELSRNELSRDEMSRNESPRNEPSRAELSRAELSRAELSRAEPESRRAEPYRAESESRRAEQYRAAESGLRRDESRADDVVPADDDPGPPRPLYPGERPGPRILIENVHVNTYGTDASVEVHLAVGGRTASGVADGPAVDGYLLRLCAMATAGAVNDLLNESDHPDGPARCFVEHAALVPFGNAQVAVVVLLLSCNSWVEQLAGSSVVSGDDRHAMVRATLAAVNRRLEALLSQ